MLQRIRDGRTDLVFEFVQQGNGAGSRDADGVSLIQWCAYYGDVSAIRFLVSQGEALIALGDNLDLQGAAFHGHWQLCQFLLEQGADANFRSSDCGETPLHAALCKANRPVYDHVVTLLLAHAGDPNVPTLPDAASGSFMRDFRTRGETALHRAAAFASSSCIQALLDAGADRERRDQNGDTPLSWASLHLRPAAVLRLLCFGEHSVHPRNHSSYDHGAGWGQLDPPQGKPHC